MSNFVSAVLALWMPLAVLAMLTTFAVLAARQGDR